MTDYVLVHGAFVNGWIWDDVARLLEADGHRVEAVDPPSAGTRRRGARESAARRSRSRP